MIGLSDNLVVCAAGCQRAAQMPPSQGARRRGARFRRGGTPDVRSPATIAPREATSPAMSARPRRSIWRRTQAALVSTPGSSQRPGSGKRTARADMLPLLREDPGVGAPAVEPPLLPAREVAARPGRREAETGNGIPASRRLLHPRCGPPSAPAVRSHLQGLVRQGSLSTPTVLGGRPAAVRRNGNSTATTVSATAPCPEDSDADTESSPAARLIAALYTDILT